VAKDAGTGVAGCWGCWVLDLEVWKSGSLEIRKCLGAVKPHPAPPMWLVKFFTPLHHHRPYLGSRSGRSRETRRYDTMLSCSIGEAVGTHQPKAERFSQPFAALRCPAVLYMQRKKSSQVKSSQKIFNAFKSRAAQ
jgi:hypothetical protein